MFVLAAAVCAPLGCQIVAGIGERSSQSAGDGGAGGGFSTQGDGGATSGAGGDLRTGAGAGGSAAGEAGEAGHGGDDGGIVPCPDVEGITEPSASWSLAEGDPPSNALSIPISIAGTEPDEWRVVLENAPEWLVAESPPDDSTALRIRPDSGVPYDAATPSTRFGVALELAANRNCRFTAEVELSVANRLHAPLAYDALPSKISAAAWHAASRRFFLLAAADRRIHVLQTEGAPALSATSIVLPDGGAVAPQAFAVSDDRLFVVTGSSLQRLTLAGASAGPAISLDPAPAGALSMAWAQGILLLGDTLGPARSLADGEDALAPVDALPSSLEGAHDVQSDGVSFAFKTLNGTQWDVFRVAPHTFEGASCSAAASAARPAMAGERVAFMTHAASGLAAVVHFATVDDGCSQQGSIDLGPRGFIHQVVGLIGPSGDRALTVVSVLAGAPAQIDLALFDLETKAELEGRLADQPVHASPVAIVMGNPKYALIVTSDRPLLIQL